MAKWVNVHTHVKPDVNALCVQHVNASEFVPGNTDEMYSVGFHPWYIEESTWKEKYKKLQKEVSDNSVVAIGESGLDKVCDTPFPLQLEVFSAMIDLSETVQKPLIIHCVRAFNEIVECSKKFQPKQRWIIHGFNRNQNIASSLLEQNIILSFGTEVLKENSPALEVLKSVSIDSFFLESDTSELKMELIYERAAMLRNESIEALKESLYTNFKSIFKNAGS
jgi:TatD DNase family protein